MRALPDHLIEADLMKPSLRLPILTRLVCASDAVKTQLRMALRHARRMILSRNAITGGDRSPNAASTKLRSTIMNALLDRVDGLSPWRFTVTLYLLRWLVLLPYLIASGGPTMSESHVSFDVTTVHLLLAFLVLAPVMETLLECAVPYWIFAKAGAMAVGRRPWQFVAVSALLMGLMHLGAWPSALLPSLVTGGFLAYTYGHFARDGLGQAVLHTCIFHAAINAVGFVQLLRYHLSL